MCSLWIAGHVFLGLVAEELAIYLHLFWGLQVLKGQWLLLFLTKALFLTFVRLLTTGSSDIAGDVQAGPCTTSYSSFFFFFFFSLLPLSTLRILYVITRRKTFSMFTSQPQLLLFYLINPFTIRSYEWEVFRLFVFPVYLWQLPWCQSSESLSQWVK